MDFTTITLRFTKTDNSVSYQVYPSAPVAVTDEEREDEIVSGLLALAASKVLVDKVEEVGAEFLALLEEYKNDELVEVDVPPDTRLH